MADTAIRTPDAPDTPEAGPGLQRSLEQRHMTMISLGGVIGAGLFVGTALAVVGAGGCP
jgi:GABA permease